MVIELLAFFRVLRRGENELSAVVTLRAVERTLICPVEPSLRKRRLDALNQRWQSPSSFGKQTVDRDI